MHYQKKQVKVLSDAIIELKHHPEDKHGQKQTKLHKNYNYGNLVTSIRKIITICFYPTILISLLKKRPFFTGKTVTWRYYSRR